jgi:hypothetical protein
MKKKVVRKATKKYYHGKRMNTLDKDHADLQHLLKNSYVILDG